MLPPPAAQAAGLLKLQVRSSADPAFDHLRSDVFAGPSVTSASDLPVQILCLENAIVTPRGFVVADDSLIWNTTYINHAWQHGMGSSAVPDAFNANGLWRYDPVRRDMLFVPPAAIETIDATCFLFNSEDATGNFAHFISDTMLQMPTFREAELREPLVPLFMGHGFRLNPARRLLAWSLGRPEPDWLFGAGRFLRVRRLVVASPHVDFATNRISRPAAMRMRALIGTALGPIPDGPERHIYISRRDTSGLRSESRIANAEPFRRLLDELNVVEVKASELSGNAYFELFKSARTIIGLHGAGLMNVLLTRDGRLIELAVPGIGGTSLTIVSEAAGYPTARLMHANALAPEVEINLDALRDSVLNLA